MQPDLEGEACPVLDSEDAAHGPEDHKPEVITADLGPVDFPQEAPEPAVDPMVDLSPPPYVPRVEGSLRVTDLPPDTDYDVILELEPVEEFRDENGEPIKAWRCEPCNLQFQYFISFNKHHEREHPDMRHKRRWDRKTWVTVDSGSESDGYIDDAFIVDSEDSDFEPDYEEEERPKRGRPRKDKPPPKKRGRPSKYGPKESRTKATGPGKAQVQDEPVKCKACPLIFDSQKLADSHYRRNHFLPYSCLMCPKKFDTFKKYYIHSEMVHDTIVDDVLQASLSDPGESDEEDRRFVVKDREEPVLYPCDMCENRYPTEIVLSGHKLRRHAEEIPDFAVIESMKRLWRSRFEPENIQQHESALEKLGPVAEERIAAGLPPLLPAKRRRQPVNTFRLSDEERARRQEVRSLRKKLRKHFGIKSANNIGPRDENGQFLGSFRTEEEKKATREAAIARRKERKRLLYQAKKEAKEKGLPIPKNLREAGIEVEAYATHPYAQLAKEFAPEDIEQLAGILGDEVSGNEDEDGESRPKRLSNIKAIESLKEFARKLCLEKADLHNEADAVGEDSDDSDLDDDYKPEDVPSQAGESEDPDFEIPDDEDSRDSNPRNSAPRAKRRKRASKAAATTDQEAGPSGSQDGPRPKRKYRKRRTKDEMDQSLICPFTGQILTAPAKPPRPRGTGMGTPRGPRGKKYSKSKPRLGKYHKEFLADTCRKCGAEFFDDALTVKHIRDVHFDPETAPRFIFERDDKMGYEATLKRAKKAFMCTEEGCTTVPNKFAYIEYLAKHMQEVHQKKMFNDDGEEISTHLPREEADKADRFRYQVCSQCDSICRGDYMEQHAEFLHTPEGVLLEYPCDFPDCGLYFRRNFKLKWHRRSVHMQLRNIQCQYCDKSFGTPYQMRKHCRIHEGFRHKCRFCETTFASNQGKINHELHIHSGKGPEHHCEPCGKSFWYERDLKKHNRTAHGQEIEMDAFRRNAAQRRKAHIAIAVVGNVANGDSVAQEGQEGADVLAEAMGTIEQAVLPRTGGRRPKAATIKDPNAIPKPRRRKAVQSKVNPIIARNELNRAVESIDLDGLDESTIGSEIEVQPDLYRAVHDHLANETVYVLQDAYNAANAQVYPQPVINQVAQPQPHQIMTRSQQHQFQAQQQQNQIQVQHQQQQLAFHQNHQHQLHQLQPAQHNAHQQHLQQQAVQAAYQLYLQPVPAPPPAVAGECKLCGQRNHDLRSHYMAFHKIPADKTHFFLSM